MNSKRLIPLLLTAAAVLLPFAAGSAPQAAPAFNHDWKKGRETGFPIPRFVSLKAAKAHMRVGPSLDYATSYVYSARGLPLEITEEYGHWRRVRDEDGSTGWIVRAASLLAPHGRRRPLAQQAGQPARRSFLRCPHGGKTCGKGPA